MENTCGSETITKNIWTRDLVLDKDNAAEKLDLYDTWNIATSDANCPITQVFVKYHRYNGITEWNASPKW